MRFIRLLIFSIALHSIFSIVTYGQLTNKYLAWLIPTKDNIINGLAIGPFLIKSDSINVHMQTVNGINSELIGKGYQIPFSNKHPYNLIDASNEDVIVYADSADFYNIRVNGINISTIGTNSDLLKINGLNFSGLFSYTGKVNGISSSILLNMSRKLNGVGLSLISSSYGHVKGFQFSLISSNASEINGLQIGWINTSNKVRGVQIGDLLSKAEDVKGVQIGFITKTEKLQGIQIGLWNINEKRKFPLINFNFSD